jgi:hypothetical protein
MDTALLLVNFLAVVWLAAWSIRDHAKPSPRWWPFDMRDAASASPPRKDAAAATRRGRGGPRRSADRR